MDPILPPGAAARALAAGATDRQPWQAPHLGRPDPFLSYPAAGRLAGTCKWMRQCLGPAQLSDALERHRARGYQTRQRTVRLWTIDDQPIVLHAISDNLQTPGMELGGRTFLGTPRLDARSSIEDRWPEFTHERRVDRGFHQLFSRLLDDEPVRVYARIAPGFDTAVLLHLHAHEEGHTVLKLTVEFFPCAWGPVGR